MVARIIGEIRPPPEVPLVQGRTLEEILERLAGFMLHAALAPRSIALHRLVTAESARFPHLARAVYDAGWAQATALIGDLLARERRLAPEERAFAAQQFIHMVVVVPQRRALGLGPPLAPRELEEWAGRVVRLFLGGIRGLSGPRDRSV